MFIFTVGATMIMSCDGINIDLTQHSCYED